MVNTDNKSSTFYEQTKSVKVLNIQKNIKIVHKIAIIIVKSKLQGKYIIKTLYIK